MTRRKTRKKTALDRSEPSPEPPRPAHGEDRVRRWLLAVLVAVYVATPLVPSEAAAELGSGIPLVMILLLLALTWVVHGLFRGELMARFEPIGTALMLLVGWLAVGAVWMAPHGAPRPAVNTVWEWVGLLVGFRMLGQLLRSAVECRAICAVMMSLAVSLSVYGIYQYAVILPTQRATYRDATPDEQAAFRRNAGIDAAEGSPAAYHFRNRLDSLEPWATFGLANSLAGFLVPWLIVLCGMVGTSAVMPRGLRSRIGGAKWGHWIGSTVSLLAIGGCLLLTKSRAGYLATGLGLILVLAEMARRGKIQLWLVLGFAAMLSMAIVLGAWLFGALDMEVLSEAPKSLMYRFEYWQATWQMIVEHPWFGCGPGNFQSRYLQYKLPQASEEVKDPHNFILEIWAVGGTPALIALLAALAGFMWSYITHASRRKSELPDEHGQRLAALSTNQSTAHRHKHVYVGGLCGVALGVPVAALAGFPLSPALFFTGLPIAVACLWLLKPWSAENSLPSWLTVTAVVVSFVNLLFAGSIAYTSVAGSIWLLMAISLVLDSDHVTMVRVPRWRMWFSAVILLGLVIACYFTAYQPILTGSDRWNPDRWRAQATEQLEAWLSSPNVATFSRFEQSAAQMLKLDSQSNRSHRQIGLWYLLASKKEADQAHLQRAVEALQRAAELYPSSSMAHAEYAWSLYLAGDVQHAGEEAAEAVRLDKLNPHEELKLGRRRLFDEPSRVDFAGIPRISPVGANAEQCMSRVLRVIR